MKKIDISTKKYSNTFAIVDDEDYEFLNQWKWKCEEQGKGLFYVTAAIKNKEGKFRGVRMHRLIMNTPEGMLVDHINHDCLDNRKSNLRICTHAENARNKRPVIGTSKYKGVYWDKTNKKWEAHIRKGKDVKYLGQFKCEKKAALAYNEKAKELFGEFAYLNTTP